MQIQPALTRHSPLAASSSPRAMEEFIIVAAQMPMRGDLWHRYADKMLEIVVQLRALHPIDPKRTYLTGFSFGGNGVFDLALKQPDFWTALWPVDPTRVPPVDPGLPVWFSSGEISRRNAQAFIRRLQLVTLQNGDPTDRVYLDRGQDHVGTASLAYQDDRIYDWLLSKRSSSPAS